MKASAINLNGVWKDVYKDPITDDGTKKSAKGLIQLNTDNGKITLNYD